MQHDRLQGNLDMLLLQLLSGGPSHGYDLILALRARSDGAFDLPEGTVYPALHRLERAGLLSSEWVRARRRRRIYQITPSGRSTLRAERARWRSFAGSMTLFFGAAHA